MRIDPREVTLMKTKSHGLDTAGDVTNARCSSVRTPGPRYAPGRGQSAWIHDGTVCLSRLRS